MDKTFSYLLSDSFVFNKLLQDFFSVILWYITSFQASLLKAVNSSNVVIPYAKLLKFLADANMLRARISQYGEHLKFKKTMPSNETNIPFMLEECELSCHNLIAILTKLITKLVISEIRQKIIANIEEQKWKYQEVNLTSISWQITKSQEISNTIKSQAFMEIEERKKKKKEQEKSNRPNSQDLCMLTPTNGLLVFQNFLYKLSEQFVIIGLFLENRNSLLMFTRIFPSICRRTNCGLQLSRAFKIKKQTISIRLE